MHTILKCFPQGKHKVLTMSYDDGQAADIRLVSIFNKYKIKGTFHLNAGLFGTGKRIPAQDISALYAGHEISAHTYTHPTIARCPLDQVAQQVLEDRRVLEGIAGCPVRGMSYPNGSYSADIKKLLPLVGIEYSRTTRATQAFALPDDLLEWHPTCHHKQNLMALGEQFAAFDRTNMFYLMYVWGHSYEFDNDANWPLIEGFCEFIGGRGDIWYATNIEIVDYLNALASMKFSAAGTLAYNPSALPVFLNADGRVVEVPGGAQVTLFSE